MRLSNGVVVVVSWSSLEDCHQALAPDMRLEAFKSLVRNPSDYQGSFEGVDNQVKVPYLVPGNRFRFGPAPDFEPERVE